MNLHAANWIARVLSLLAIVPLILIAFGEYGDGPTGVREWIYFALFPFGFSAGYLAAWYRPLFGGVLAISCMIASLIIIGRPFPPQAYAIWAGLCAALFLRGQLLKPVDDHVEVVRPAPRLAAFDHRGAHYMMLRRDGSSVRHPTRPV